MKKRLLILVGFLLYFTTTQAQQSDHFLFEGNGVVDYKVEGAALKMQMQIGAGLPYNIYKNTTNNLNVTTGFPYGVLYIGPTFRVDKFEVSKGYFTDRVNIKWQLSANNRDKVTNIEVYRRVLGSNQDFVFLANLKKDDSEYRDELIEGGVLFEYQIRAIGIPITNGSIGVRTLNYMEGIGFRNPTATVSGGITFEGGSPVQDVKVSAEPIGAQNSTATSLYVPTAPAGGVAKIEDITNIKADSITFQTWLVNDTNIFSFKLSDDSSDTYEIYAGNWNNETIDFNLQKNNDQLSGIKIAHSYPTGKIDAAGNDKFAAISSLGQKGFVHLSLVIRDGKKAQFFINGREINDTYEAAIKAKNPNLTIRIDDFTGDTVSLANNPSTVNLTELVLGNGFSNFFMDEARVWNRALSPEEIRRDYRRYLGGGEAGLAVYLRMDEGEGDYLYDLSKDGFTQNKNDALLSQISNTTVKFSDTIPTNEQLGVFGITDKNGSYIVSGISYKGSGESFAVKPSLGVHKFEPGSQTVFLGSESSVINQLNFTDISSFKFNGRVVYNVQDVFPATTPEKITSVRDAGYNKYTIVEDGETKTVNKGQYYYEGGTNNNGVYTGGVLKKYPVIGVEGANVLVDGNTVFDADNQPVLTNQDGEFTVNVPIGNHKVEVVKGGHTFELNGRFPETGTFQFFEDQIEPQYFTDDTRITLVGRIVGGRSEFEKPIGFGANGLFEVVSNEGKVNEVTETVSSINNIGIAKITFKGDVNSNLQNKVIETNTASGEFKAALVPLQYTIKQDGIKIESNTDIPNFFTSNETLDLREVPELITSEFTTEDNQTINSEPYHYEKSFRYNSDVSVVVLSQQFETEITINENRYDISNLTVPIYNKDRNYNIVFEVSQKYINKDDANNVIETKEFFNEGVFNITNNLAAIPTDPESVRFSNNKYTYSFSAGYPNISIADDFDDTITVSYSIEGKNPISIENSGDFKNEGIINGGRPTAGTRFLSVAPEKPDIILRDPPGSNSFATIEKGTTISYEESRKTNNTNDVGGGVFVSVGPEIDVQVAPVPSISVNLNRVDDISGTFSKTTEDIADNTTKNTYTFNQTFSTSDSPEFVGSDGDLYIGNAKNIYMGVFDRIYITEQTPSTRNAEGTNINIASITVEGALDSDGDPATIHISTYKDYFIAEQPTKTFFTYSQKFLVDELIPELDSLASGAKISTKPRDSITTKAFFKEQSNLWKKVIRDNERAKYRAKNSRNAMKDSILSSIEDKFKDNTNTETLKTLLDRNYFSNRSFDAGLGQYTNTVESVVLVSNSYETVVDVAAGFDRNVGAFAAGLGVSLNINYTNNSITDDTDTDVSEVTNKTSYTLKDNDRNNSLSVDVVNLFDGSGPVFITRGGNTSCPYEDEEETHFYNHSEYEADNDAIGTGGEIISQATNKVYNSEISVESAVLKNIPEDEDAVFILYLKNTSEVQVDLEFILDFESAIDGLEVNIESNGLNVFLPYNETVEFPLIISKPSSISDFKFDNIRIFLKNPCATFDESRETFVDVSVEFKKSCSNVTISSPEDNWVFNRNEGINADGTNNSLPITFTDFNTGFNGFEKIELQYRNTGAPSWGKLATYYGSAQLRSDAGDVNEGILISESDVDFTFNWKVIEDKIPDGNYEFRAITFCTDNITNSSEIISGTINLNAPLVFGTPKPTDGILDPGEDISIRFNEAIFARTTEDITVTGLQNQQKIDHSVSVFLDGSTNQIELPNQRLDGSSFTLQFWYQNPNNTTGTIVSQENGITVKVANNNLEFSIGGKTVKTDLTTIPVNSQYNFYSFVYQNGTSPQLLIFENGVQLKKLVLNSNLDINTSASIFIGGQNVEGNLHDVRLWSKPFTPAQASLAKDLTLTGRELNLQGYWKLDEGFGKTALDKAKRKNAIINLDWAIKPVGTGYEFKNNAYIKLDSVKFVQPTNFEDITLSFWIKPSTTSSGTIFSNGRGTDNDKEVILTNGFRNKWSLNLNAGGNLELVTENITYPLTTTPFETDNWSHVAIVRKVGGSLNSYINGKETTSVSSALTGGFSGSRILIGARLYTDPSLNLSAENHFTGLLDEVRFWNTARSLEQIKRDRYFEIDNNTEGLILKIDFNQDQFNTTAGPEYNHLAVNLTKANNFSTLSDGSSQSYTQDTPPLKPQLQFTNIPFTTVINGDEMIISPNLTDAEWSLFEGEIIDFTVAGLTDTHFNRQSSPVTWSALVNRQELEWFTEKKSKEIITEKILGESYSFTMDVVNIGGSNQPFTISGLPTWMQVEITTGSVAPNSNREIIFTVDEELSMGNYTADIFLETASGFNDRLSFNLRVLSEAPDWSVNAADYATSMNFIGKIQIDGEFSRDTYTKVGAFVNDEPRGEAFLKYDAIFDSYFVFLTAYSNSDNSQEKVTFKIWDAVNGKIIAAFVDNATEVDYLINGIEGSKSSPKIFANSNLAEQNLALNKGWTWVSLYANDPKLLDVTQTFSTLNLTEKDGLKSQTKFSNYENGFWSGDLTQLSTTEMYKIKLGSKNQLRLLGSEIIAANFTINVDGKSKSDNGNTPQWNWLPFPIHRDVALQEALAFYEPTDGDVIKDQFNFAIYDVSSGWSGTLNYLQSGNGYMLNASKTQTFNYPDGNVLSKSTVTNKVAQKIFTDSNNFAAYSSNMNIVAEVIDDENYTKVLVYDANNVLRGISDIVDINNKRISFITAFSNIQENLKFVLANDLEQLDINKGFLFVNNLVMGDLKNPVQLSSKALSLIDLVLSDAVLYPNPFTSEITIDLSNENIKISKVEIFNTIGVSLISKKASLSQKTTINTVNLVNGIYLIRLTDNAGKFVVKKMIKE